MSPFKAFKNVLVQSLFNNHNDGQGDPLGIVRKIETWTYEQIHKLRICLGELNVQNTQRFWDTNGSQKKTKRIWGIVDFAFPAENRVELNENEKKDKYHDLIR